MDTQHCNGFQTTHMLYLSAISTTVMKNTGLKLFWLLHMNSSFIYLNWKLSNWGRVLYRNLVLNSKTYLCSSHWPIRNEIFLRAIIPCSTNMLRGSIIFRGGHSYFYFYVLGAFLIFHSHLLDMRWLRPTHSRIGYLLFHIKCVLVE